MFLLWTDTTSYMDTGVLGRLIVVVQTSFFPCAPLCKVDNQQK